MANLIPNQFIIPNVVVQSPNVIYKNQGVSASLYPMTQGRITGAGAFLRITRDMTAPTFQVNTFSPYVLPEYQQNTNIVNPAGVKV